MAKKEKASLTEAVSAELKKGFSLDKFKEKKLLTGTFVLKTSSGFHYHLPSRR
jgi:hypothetical protein